ncbi:DUF2235 domain-containing protein [Desulfovibrio sp. TomC]|uniref:DUF2235 domain-containing protein n=1 Tax=Desulfovibrio sp. TomC TaxID=1562888 RepID=UPI00057492F2|nr:DUF2235 domain-containing protein [Desulfovibrio sp. TomC]KHK00121.1 hypothetical protein NY78_4465 [Desulfovibrio sp. TomC]
MKRILFCADGTWNGPTGDTDGDNLPDATNVFKLFCCLPGNDSPDSLILQNEQERVDDATKTVAKYLHGVGDSNNPLVKALGGVFGSGLITRIIRGFTFLSRNYTPGDKIILVGFSRGAYTVRALAGFIAACGLLDASEVTMSNQMEAYIAAVNAWNRYRRQAKGHGMDRIFDWFPRIFSHLIHDKTTGGGSVPIEAVGVWDTVGALGIPVYNLQRDTRYNLFEFDDCVLSSQVKHGFHAVSVDEERVDFTPTLWKDDSRITQMLFAGAHADVGGGYNTSNNESDLSNIALDWMLTQLGTCGVIFRPECRSNWCLAPANPLGPSHQPWTEGVWRTLPHAPRTLPPEHNLKIAASIKDRLNQSVTLLPSGQTVVYNPQALGDVAP